MEGEESAFPHVTRKRDFVVKLYYYYFSPFCSQSFQDSTFIYVTGNMILSLPYTYIKIFHYKVI